jgi:2-aminoethylphosphonate-pyruvate transaminase
MLTRNILLIPGPLTTSIKVTNKLLYDYSAREDYFINIIKSVRKNILKISKTNPHNYTTILIQGSGTYGNESVISSIPKKSKISVFSNGLYGNRLKEISKRNNKLYNYIELPNHKQITPSLFENSIKYCNSTHIALVHNETTSGIINPINNLVPIAKKYNKKVIVDAISSYGGIPININKLDIDYLIGSSNKCLHGHPGLSFIIAKKETLEECKHNKSNLSLNLYEQFLDFEKHEQFRFTPPVQIINSLSKAIYELEKNGGIHSRYEHYKLLNSIVYNELINIGFKPYLNKEINSPVVSTYIIPDYLTNFNFDLFARNLKKHKIILYPSPINNPTLIRISNIGDITINELNISLTIFKHELMKFR